MRKVLLAVFVMLFMVSSCFAGSSNGNVGVNASIGSSCVFVQQGEILTFSIHDPSIGTTVYATFNNPTTIKCTNKAGYSVSAKSTNKGVSGSCVGGIVGTVKDSDGNTFDYIFSCVNGAGAGFGNGKEKDLSLTASVYPADYQNAVTSSTYTDTVVVTINY